ncbi:hypothetical protein BJX70DRAFT_223774 [Aspergillus crustosus]
MSNPKYAWDGTGDVLQGISGTPSQAEFSTNGLPSSNLTPGDPASFLGFQFGSDQGVLPHGHASYLNQWMPSAKHSNSPTPQPHDCANYSSARFLSNQDSWNPLQVTGVPPYVGFSGRPMGRIHQVSGLDRRCSTGHSDPSETGSQYTGLQSSDSGYSSRSWTTRSVAASYAVDSAYSPHLAEEYEQDEKAPLDTSSTHHSEAIDMTERSESPSLLCQDTIGCEYRGCPWTGKCPSDKRKHEARHMKLFKCDEPNCTRKEGFGTINDLARHKKCVHKKEPERGPKVLYMCFGRNCPRNNKKWPRLDNFRQHLARMHNNENLDDLLRRSHEWYGSVKPRGITPTYTDNVSEDTAPSQVHHIPEHDFRIHDADHRFQNPIAAVRAAYESSNLLTLDSIQRLDQGHDMHEINQSPSQVVDLSALPAVDLKPVLEHQPGIPSELLDQRHDRMDDMISEAAASVINAMTKMINNHQRRRGHPGEEDMVEDGGELSNRNREILQKILITASGLLSGNTVPGNSMPQENTSVSSDKTSWIQCEYCPKQTRLRCEMKKHQKRHERPYGCTFPGCDKTFGSKADWKRHEQSQHFGVQSWQCTLPDTTQTNALCARMFDRQDAYAQHLETHHLVDEEEMQISICRNRLGWNGEPQFWCGFCCEIIDLQGDGLAAWNQRFNHIDIEHFKKGERIDDWFLPTGQVSKSLERGITQGVADALKNELVASDNSDAGSMCSNYSEDSPLQDFVADDRAMSFEPPLVLFRRTEGPALAPPEPMNNRKRKHHYASLGSNLAQLIETREDLPKKRMRV